MTHSAGGPFGFYVLEARPKLVKGIVVVEGAQGSAVFGPNRWGLINLPVEYDPPVSDPSQVKTKQVQPTRSRRQAGHRSLQHSGRAGAQAQELEDCAICVYTSEASFVLPNPGAVAFLKQAGVHAEEIRLADIGIHGNGHLMMGEKNNRETLKPILAWLDKNVNHLAPLPKYRAQEGRRFHRDEARRPGLLLGRHGREEDPGRAPFWSGRRSCNT